MKDLKNRVALVTGGSRRDRSRNRHRFGYARSVTNEMVAAHGRFLEEMWDGVERKIPPQSATDRIESVGA